MSERDRDMPEPPPGGFLREPRPAGPEEAGQEALRRIADALEDVRSELREIRRVLERLPPSRG